MVYGITMTKRLTPEFTPTLEEAFGPNGAIGERGEVVVERYLKTTGAKVISYPESYEAQAVFKIDIAFKYPDWKDWVTANIKATQSTKQPPETFRVNLNLIREAVNVNTVDRWWHVNLITGDMAYYDVHEMLGFLTRRLDLYERKPDLARQFTQYYDDQLLPKAVFEEYFTWIGGEDY